MEDYHSYSVEIYSKSKKQWIKEVWHFKLPQLPINFPNNRTRRNFKPLK